MKKILSLTSILSLTLTCAIFGNANASSPTIDNSRVKEFSQNSINLYNPYECVSGGANFSGNCGGEITSSGNGERVREMVRKYGTLAMNLQITYGVSWEFLIAQMAAESGVGTTGIAAVQARDGKYNWIGLTCGQKNHSTAHYANGLTQYRRPANEGGCYESYDSIELMMKSYASGDFFRNGNYDNALAYTDKNNYDMTMFARSAFSCYVQGNCGGLLPADSFYVKTTLYYIENHVRPQAQELGYPTSAELQKQYNLSIGGKYPIGTPRDQLYDDSVTCSSTSGTTTIDINNSDGSSNANDSTNTPNTAEIENSETESNAEDTTDSDSEKDDEDTESTSDSDTTQTNSDSCNVTTSGAGEAIAQTAIRMAWPEGTDRSVYYGNSGVPEEFTRVAEKWGFDGWPSCSRFASMTILESGVDSEFESILPPKGSRRNNLYTLEKYFANSENWMEVPYEERQRGDIIINHKHVEIYIGDDKKAHAGEIGTSSPKDNFGPHIAPLTQNDRTIYKYYRSTNASTSISVSGGAAGCGLCREDSNNSSSHNDVGEEIGENGLDYEQAVKFMKNYGANINDSSRKATGDDQWFISGCNNKPSQGLGGSNCVTFSAFFLNKFTDTRYQGGNGYTLVKNLTGIKTDTTPSVWAIFGDSSHDSHTGVILGYQDGEWIVGHASCRNVGLGEGSGTKDGSGKKLGEHQFDISSGAGFVIKSSDLKTAQLGYQGQIYAHPNVDVEAISKYLNNRE